MNRDIVRLAVRMYHNRRPGNRHDRIEEEIEEDVEHFMSFTHPRWSQGDYREIKVLYQQCEVQCEAQYNVPPSPKTEPVGV